MTTSTAQFRTDRATAGAAYAAAAQAYVTAWVELSAYDAIVRSPNLGGDVTRSELFHQMPTVLQHADYLSQSASLAMVSGNVLPPAVAARIAVLTATWSGS